MSATTSPPAVQLARSLADDLIRPIAEQVDRTVVPRSHLPADDGWRFDGHVGWMTGWGVCDLFLLGAVTAEGDLVLAFVPAREAEGLTASALMSLAVMQATLTVTLDLDGYRIPLADVPAVVPATEWPAVDAAKTANASPHVFGLQREAIFHLVQAQTAPVREATLQLLREVGA